MFDNTNHQYCKQENNSKRFVIANVKNNKQMQKKWVKGK